MNPAPSVDDLRPPAPASMVNRSKIHAGDVVAFLDVRKSLNHLYWVFYRIDEVRNQGHPALPLKWFMSGVDDHGRPLANASGRVPYEPGKGRKYWKLDR